MSTTIDKKVVEMQFDNRNFESNVQTSMSTIEKLKQALSFEGLRNGLAKVGDAFGRVDVAPLGDAVDSISGKFSALETIAVGALMKIGSSAVDAGAKVLKSLTIDQVTAGWDKYESITRATQTIMAATAKDWDNQEEQLEYINAQMDKLNWYTDETSFNLADMTSNISKFTSNGVALDQAVTSMEGIGTWSALAGATIPEMSRAMYNISQAMGSGVMLVRDWMSIENANMATEEFKQTAIDTAVALGKLKKNQVTVGTFRDSLGDLKWFDSEVMNAVFSKYGEFTDQLYELYQAFWDVGEQMTTSDLLDMLSEYKDGMLDLSKVSEETGLSIDFLKEAFDNLADSDMGLGEKGFRAAQEAKTLQEAIDAVKDAVSTGWMNSFKIIFGDYLQAKKLWTDLANSLYDVFAAGGEARNDLLKEWAGQGGRDLLFRNEKDDADEMKGALWQLYDAFLSVAGPIREAWDDIFPPITAKRLVELTQKFQELTQKLKLSNENQERLKNTFKGVFAVMSMLKQIFVAIVTPIKSFLGITDGLGTSILKVTGGFGEWLAKLAKFTEENNVFGKAVGFVVDKVKDGYNAFKSFLGQMGARFDFPWVDTIKKFFVDLKEGFKNVDFSSMESFKESFRNIWGIVEGTPVFQKISEGFQSVKSWAIKAKDGVNSAIQFMKPTFQAVGKWFADSYNSIKATIQGENFQNRLKTIGDALVKFKDKAVDVFKKVVEYFKGIGQQANTQGLGDKVVSAKDKIVNAFKAVVEYVKGLNIKDWFQGVGDKFTSISGSISEAFGKVREAFSQVFGKKEETEGGGNFIDTLKEIFDLLLSGGILVAIKKFSDSVNGVKETIEKLKEGFLESITKQTQTMTKKLNAEAIKNIAVALALLAGSLWLMAQVPAQSLAVAAGALGVLVVELIAAAKKLSEFSKAMSKSETKNLGIMVGEMVILAGSLLLLGLAINQIGQLPPKNILAAGAVVAALIEVMKKAFIEMSQIKVKKEESAVANIAKMVAFAQSIKVLAGVVKQLGKMDTDTIMQGGISITVLIGEVTGSMVLLNKYGSSNMEKFAGNIIALSISLGLLAGVVTQIGKMDIVTGIQGAVGIGVLLTEIGVFMGLMSKSFKDNANMGLLGLAMIELSVGLGLMAGAVREFGNMPLEVIAVGLGAFVVVLFSMVGAAKLLGNSVVQLLALGVAMEQIGIAAALFGASVALIGVGVALIVSSLGAFAINAAAAATAFIAAIGIITYGFSELLPLIIENIGKMIVGVCKVIEESAPAIKDAAIAVLISAIQMFTESIPMIVEAILNFVEELLVSIDEHVPDIVNLVLDILIKVFEVLRDRVPELVHVIAQFLDSLFGAILEEIQNIDPAKFEAAVTAFGSVVLLVIGASELLPLIPKAMLAIAGLALVVAEIAALFNALGLLLKIPGFEEGLDQGIYILTKVGEGLGAFVGSVIGGIAEGVTSVLPTIGEHLSRFMENAQPFFDGLNGINDSGIASVKNLAEMLLVITAAELIERITNFAGGLLGNSSLESFGKQLAAFAPNFRTFAENVEGITPENVEAASNAAMMMTEVANALPNLGGVAGFLAGDQSLETFGKQLAAFGPYISEFAASIDNITPEKVEAAATSAKLMAEVVNLLPNLGGVAGFLAGDQSLETFGKQLAAFGPYAAQYADTVSGISAEQLDGSTRAISALIAMATEFAYNSDAFMAILGQDSLNLFGLELKSFGPNFKAYVDSVADITFADIEGSTAAAKAISEFANNLPKHGGLLQAYTGDNSLAAFAAELLMFGPSFAAYVKSVEDISVAAVNRSVKAASALSELEANLPPVEGIMPFLQGTHTLAGFALELELFGIEFAAYANSVKDISVYEINRSVAAASALSELEANLPPVEGIMPFINGTNSLFHFGEELASFGPEFAKYAESVKGIDIAAVKASADAAAALSTLQSGLETTGGFMSWFTGDKSFSGLADGLADLGTGLKSYAESVAGFSEEDTVAIGFSLKVAKKLAELQPEIEKSGGKFEWLTGSHDFSHLADGLADLGEALKKYLSEVKSFTEKDVEAVERSKTIALAITEMQKSLVGEGGLQEAWSGTKDLADFGSKLKAFGTAIKDFTTEVRYINPSTIYNTVNSVNRITEMCKNMSGKEQDLMTGFSAGLTSMANAGISEFIKAFENADKDFENAAASTINSFKIGIANNRQGFTNEFVTTIQNVFTVLKAYYTTFENHGKSFVTKMKDGAHSKKDEFVNALKSIITSAANTLISNKNAFYEAGANLAQGLANGVTSKTPTVKTAASNVAKAATKATKDTLQEKSPSKVGYEIGDYYVVGIANGMYAAIHVIEKAGKLVGEVMQDAVVNNLDDGTMNIKLADSSTVSAKDLNNAKAIVASFELMQSRLKASGSNNIISEIMKLERFKGLNPQIAYNNYMKELNEARAVLSAAETLQQSMKSITDDGVAAAEQRLADSSPAIANLLSGGEVTTTVVPVIDLTEAEEGASELNDMLNGSTSINLAEDTGENLAKIIENQNEMIKAQKTIIDEINEFQEQFGGLSDKIDRLRMYLDGDALVGGIVDRMDKALGKNYVYAGRGN